MKPTVWTALPEYRVKASCEPAGSPNLIHSDDFARHCGFRMALVPGSSIYAYIANSLVQQMGQEWLRRGYAEIRFVHPVHEGEELRITGGLQPATADAAPQVDFTASNPQGVVCAAGFARLPAESPSSPPTLEDYPAGDQVRRPINFDTLALGQPLAAAAFDVDATEQWAYCRKIVRDHNPLYLEYVHPGWLLHRANLILPVNFDLPAWIHVASSVQKFRCKSHGGTVEARGKVVEKFERKGHHFAVLDIALFSDGACLETIRHVVIFRIAPRAA